MKQLENTMKVIAYKTQVLSQAVLDLQIAGAWE